MTDQTTIPEAQRAKARAAFMQAVAGVPAHHVTKALNTLTPGVDWSRCSKGYMAKEYARAILDPRRAPTPALARIDLLTLSARARARWGERSDWWDVTR